MPIDSRTLRANSIALTERRKLQLRYARADGTRTQRVVRPLGAFFWGRKWTLTAWCELRSDFRTFRLDRIVELEPLAESFDEEPGRTLRDYLRGIGESAERLLGE